VAAWLAALPLPAAAQKATPPKAAAAPSSSATPAHRVEEQDVEDLKSVFATVRSKDRIEARVRTPGTVVSLKVDEGRQVEPGQLLALVADPKIALKMRALDAQIVGLQSRVANAKAELDRAEALRTRGVTPQARVDQLKTAFDVATNELKAASSERLVAEEQVSEGQVLAPAKGRVLKVPVTEGSVVLAGESIATIAANDYLLRLELPERHARFMKEGDRIRIASRGLSRDQQSVGEGRIVQVYPELQNGRVLADAEVAGLDGYFVGERALVWIGAGRRRVILVPADLVRKRFGLDYVRVAGDKGAAIETVVQLGQGVSAAPDRQSVEVLAGLKAGDMLLDWQVKP
jgi:RND family efflux transporter MFP subunit